jgi:hypothetical protein
VAAPSYQASAPEPAPVAAPAPSYQTAPSGGYKKAARASKTVLADTKCNSQELRQILADNIVEDDANESKRRVHKAANEQVTTQNSERGLDVICAPTTFSYRIATDLFCEHTKANITCFVYQQWS